MSTAQVKNTALNHAWNRYGVLLGVSLLNPRRRDAYLHRNRACLRAGDPFRIFEIGFSIDVEQLFCGIAGGDER